MSWLVPGRLSVKAMAALGLRAADLGGMRRGAPEKAVLAWWLRGRTTASLGWIAERLEMGHESRVSQAVARMRRRPGRRLKALERKLAAAEQAEATGTQ